MRLSFMRDGQELDDATRAVVAERERIGRELRGGVMRKLFAAGLTLQCAIELIDDPRAAERVTSTIGELDTIIREIRDAVAGLTPSVTHDEPARA